MKLNVNLTDLELAAAKMGGLDSYLCAIRKANLSFSVGLQKAKQFATDNNGEILPIDSNGVTTIKVLGENAHCYQLYPDIDRFYYET